MVQLDVLLPLLGQVEEEDIDDAAASSHQHSAAIDELVHELAEQGVHSDTELLFLDDARLRRLGVQARRTLDDLELQAKCAAFLAAEGRTSEELCAAMQRDGSHHQASSSSSFVPLSSLSGVSEAATGVDGIDKLLDGGLADEIVEIVGEHGTAKSHLAMHTVLRHLHANPTTCALWLDTTSSFSADQASSVLQTIEAASATSNAVQAGQQNDNDAVMDNDIPAASDKSSNALDRLIVAKTYDLQSAIQAIQQFRSRTGGTSTAQTEDSKLEIKKDNKEEEAANSAKGDEVPSHPRFSSVTRMSQASKEHTANPEELENKQSMEQSGQLEHEAVVNQQEHVVTVRTSSYQPQHLRFIVIDEITSILKNVLSATTAEGHARMMSFMRLLRSLTNAPQGHGGNEGASATTGTTIFLINGLVSLAPTANSNAAFNSVFPALNNKRVKPALGPTFTELTDWTLYLSHAPDVFAELKADRSNGPHRQLILEVVRSRRMVRADEGKHALVT